MKYDNLLIAQNATVRDAMKQLNNTARGLLLVIDGQGKLYATLTDGDIRRHILAGGELEESVIGVGNQSPRIATDVSSAKSLYNAISYQGIPIVDDDGYVIDVYFSDDVSECKYSNIDIPVVINAGGKGTRLEPYTKVLPKPLIPIGDYPIVEHIIREFRKYSCNDIHMIVNYKKEVMKAYFSESDTDYGIVWHDEDKPLGTGGGLSLLRGMFDGPFFFTNCDILVTADYEGMVKFHKENNNLVTMVCAYKTVVVPYGVVDLGVNGAISGMQEKPEFTYLTNTGMYLLDPRILDFIEDDTPIGFPDIVEKLRLKGEKVAAYPIRENDWYDMGQIKELEEMRARLYGSDNE